MTLITASLPALAITAIGLAMGAALVIFVAGVGRQLALREGR